MEAKDFLGLSVEDAHRFNIVLWENRLIEEMHYNGTIKEKLPWKRYDSIVSMIRTARIFYSPVGEQGFYFAKPPEYLAAALYDSGQSMVQIASSIERLVLSSARGYGSTALGLAFPEKFADVVAEQARQYLYNFPGNDASECNNNHTWFRLIAEGAITDREHLEVLSAELLYRNALTGVATRCKNLLGLPIKDAHLFDAWAWLHKQKPNEHWDRSSIIHDAINDASVFGHPEPHQGLFFAKPTEYLAIGFAISDRPMERIFGEIDGLTARGRRC